MSQAVSGPEISHASEVDRAYSYWRFRTLYSTIIGYAIYYFVRSNFGGGIPVMQQALHVSRSQLGFIGMLGKVTYGISKLINGIVGDRVNARYFMALGLLCSGIVNVCFGLSTGLITLGCFSVVNGWFQGMGFPPCARVMAHWFSPS